MAIKKYIGTKEAMRLTGLKQEEVYELIHSGKLPARKAPKSGWRILPEDLDALGFIKEKNETVFEEPVTENCATYVADEQHYTQVFKRMTEVKRSLKIATANLKNFNVSIEDENVRLCDFFMSLVERGVHETVRILPLHKRELSPVTRQSSVRASPERSQPYEDFHL